MVPDPLVKDKQADAAKDVFGPNTEDWGKGLLQTKIIQIPDDPNLKAIMKENEVDFNDYAKDFFFNTNVLFQEVQKSQIKIFNKQQKDFKSKVEEIGNYHQQQIHQVNQDMLELTKQIKQATPRYGNKSNKELTNGTNIIRTLRWNI